MRVDRDSFLKNLQILKKVIGRSDETFQFVEFQPGGLSAWDGCLSVSVEVNMDLPVVSIPINTLYSVIKMCEDDLEICHEDSTVLKCGDLHVIFEDFGKKVKRAPLGEKIGEISDYIQGLDFISKPMSEEDMIEVHFGSTSVAHAMTSNISVFYVFDGFGKRFSFSMPYQSVRRLSKAAHGLRNWEIFGGKYLGFRSEGLEGSICGEVLYEQIAIPKLSSAEKLEENFRKMIKKGSALLGPFEADISVAGGKVTIAGGRGGMIFAMSENVNLDQDFKIKVPLRKFSSYLSDMSSVWISVDGGLVKFADGRRKRYVITKKVV